MIAAPQKPRRPVAAARPEWDGWVADMPAYGKLMRAGEMGRLALAVIRALFTPRFWWIPECLNETSVALRRCFIPALFAMTAFGVGLACDFFGGIVRLLGTADRLGGGIGIGFLREPGVWVAIMILAGVAGSSMCADLGARKIREELDALKVLGVEEMRGLILPRVIALTLVGPILGTFTVFVAWLSTYIATPIAFHGSTVTLAAFVDTFKAFVSPLDLINFVVKLTCAGFLVGVVCCYKGIRSSGGAEGVGRAVNEAVLISFFGVWMINILFNTLFLSLFPQVSILKG
ncbi:MAG TPA: ABC transporter permease [Solirubrobacteraceae bacterium]|nr:ABC transporter permease [Solirubrobacteraceae bacterium]